MSTIDNRVSLTFKVSVPNGLYGMNIEIRSALVEEADAIKQLINMTNDHYIERLGMLSAPMLDFLPKVIQDFNVTVACKNSGIVGILVLKIESMGVLLDNMAVHPEYQGYGIGKKLIAIAQERAINLRFSCITFYTHEKMIENIDLYQQLGYRETKRINEFGYNRLNMCKNF